MTGAHQAGSSGHGDARPGDPEAAGESGAAVGSGDPVAPDRTPEAAAKSRRRSRAWRIGTPAVVLLSGALFATSAIASDGTDLRPGRYTDLAGLVNSEAQGYRHLAQQRRRLARQVDQLTSGVSSHGVARARGKLASLEDPAGLTPKSGPGLTITLSDAPTDVLDAAVAANNPDLDLNRLVVHQQDIQAVVNALWSGGAKAVTIAGQRVVSTTGIKCEGNAVQLQGVPYPQPYVIQAVGDPGQLLASIDSDALVAGFRADSANPTIDVGWSMQVEDHVSAPAYDGLVDLHYAKPLTSKK
ncbi:MAG: DUF881 domain-containing protein [Nocardioidaceae bacterium]|nr:DUF881 domain-containing protein [Nocardioidaceae bacterium]MCL2614277.1 DUF881 domain-containing protein [Nocardioidaceae bacterium]